MLLTPFLRHYLSRRTFFEADKATASGPAGAAPTAEAKPAEGAEPEGEDPGGIGEFPGSEMLEGADFSLKPPEPTSREWTADEEEEEGEGAGVGGQEAGGKEQEQEHEIKAGEETVDKNWPESARKRVDKLTAQKSEAERERDALKAEKAALEQQVAEAKQSGDKPQPAQPATAADPLSFVSDEAELDQVLSDAQARRQWALENWDGGELPQGEGKDPLVLSGADVRQLFARTDAMLTRHVPAKRKYLTEFKQAESYLKTRYPQFLDTSTPDGQAFARAASQFPMVKAMPNWMVIVADALRGQSVRLQEEKEAMEKAAKKTPEIAPPVINPPATPQVPAKPKARKSAEKLSASMDAEQLAAAL